MNLQARDWLLGDLLRTLAFLPWNLENVKPHPQRNC